MYRSREESSVARVPKAADLVAARLRREIVRGEIRQGATLALEAELITRFGVSRPTLREAIRILESEGLISVTRGARGGAKVHPPDVRVASRYMGLLMQYAGATLEDVYLVRTMLEPPAARFLAENHDEAQLDLLREILEHEEASIDDAKEHAMWATRFYEAIAELTGNTALAMMVGVLHDIAEVHMARVLARQANRDDPERRLRQLSIRSQEKLVELISRGDGKGAEAHWRSHVNAVADAVLSKTGRDSKIELL